MPFETRNPATGELVEAFRDTTDDELGRVLDRGHAAFLKWRRTPVGERAARLRDVAKALRKGAAAHAETMALEMGKPVAQGEAEATKCAVTCDWYAENAARMLEPDPRPTEAAESYVRFDPLGTVLAIMPWNFPFWQVFRFAAPALAAGNSVLLKHAPNVPRCALAIAETFRAAGFPEGIFESIFVEPATVPRILADDRVAAVTLTGSDRAGRSVGEAAGKVLKRSVLELGGSDAFLILEDADVDAAAKAAAEARLLNGGQSCIAAKRFVVVEAVADRFVEKFLEAMQKKKMGDPFDRQTDVGPMARPDLRDALARQVDASVKAGARAALGGSAPSGAGAFYPPTVLTGVKKGMAAFDEETFGPAAAVVRARDDVEAVSIANDSPYGLGASVWTADRARAKRIAAELEVGCVFVNAFVKSDPRMPFGGVKQSGYGRELSEFGMREFVNVKSVWIER